MDLLELSKLAKMHEDRWLTRQKRKRQKLLVANVLFDYAKNSTLHGLRYIVDRQLTIYEKVFWFVTFVASLTICSYHISNVYVKWQTSPLMVTVSEKLVSAGMVPIPSVTICPQIKSKASLYNFTEQSCRVGERRDICLLAKAKGKQRRKMSKKEFKKYTDVAMLCGHFADSLDPRFNKLTSDLNIVQTIYDVSPNIWDVFSACFVQGEYKPCDEIFNRVLTAEGLCFNFNGIAAEELFRNYSSFSMSNITYNHRPSRGWTHEKGYDDLVADAYPVRGREIAARPDLELMMHENTSESDRICNYLNSGFKIYLHNPVDVPKSSLHYYSAMHNQISSLAVDLNMLTTSENLQAYKPEIRQCYFAKEKYLRYFKIYTAKNCQFECLANITLKKCHCRPYFMPHETDTNICRYKHRYCMELAQEEMIARELRIDKQSDNEEYCRCLPACNSIEYDAESVKADYSAYRIFSTLEKALKSPIKYTKIDIYFKKSHYITLRRSELFGWTDFVSNIGGLLGVFLGFSFLSVLEIIYFISLRVGFTLKRDINEEKNKRNNINLKV